jgi:DNA recombination protein RmuC
MQMILILLLGLAIGAVVGWLLANTKSKAELANYKIQSEGNLRVAEATTSDLRTKQTELRSELEAKNQELNGLQQQLRAEGEQKAGAQAELRQTRASLEDLASVRDQLSSESQLRVAAETKLKETELNLEEQRKLLGEATARLTDTFGALSAEALKSNNQAFLALAKSTFETIQTQAKGDIESRQKAIDGLVAPLKESLDKYEKQVIEMEKSRESAYGRLDEQLKNLAGTNQQLQKETGSLVTALRFPQVRGRWGEMTLRRTAELAGMAEHCDFVEQETMTTDEGRQQRPDMIVNLPGGRRIVIDAKVPLQAFLDAASATNEEERHAQLSRHAQLVRTHMNQLASRGYSEQFDFSPEVVVLFLPGESFFAAALEEDRSLIEDAMERRVILSTPTTLIALLKAIAYGWRQEQMAENAQAISELGKQLYDRIRTFVGHFESVGGALGRAVDSYNKATGSLESRVLPSARRFKELGAATGEEIVEIEPVDESPRALAIPEKSET